jgi:hypothetical protein
MASGPLRLQEKDLVRGAHPFCLEKFKVQGSRSKEKAGMNFS